jgi:carbonic anhydrase
MEPSNCPWCGEWSRYIVVNGHYECGRCKNVVADCCDGEQEQIWEDLQDKAGA